MSARKWTEQYNTKLSPWKTASAFFINTWNFMHKASIFMHKASLITLRFKASILYLFMLPKESIS